MEKKLVYGLVVLVVFLVVAFFLFNFVLNLFAFSDSITYSENIEAEDKYCEEDSDCKIVHLGCCHRYSNPKLVSVNQSGEQKIAEWKQDNCVECKINNSVRIFTNIRTAPFCQENQCQVKYVPGCEKISLLCNEDEAIRQAADPLTQDQLNKLGMTEEEVLEYCGC